MFVAAYRIAFDGWTAEEAIQEMKAFHYKEILYPEHEMAGTKIP